MLIFPLNSKLDLSSDRELALIETNKKLTQKLKQMEEKAKETVKEKLDIEAKLSSAISNNNSLVEIQTKQLKTIDTLKDGKLSVSEDINT
jgi:hypothetical protein